MSHTDFQSMCSLIGLGRLGGGDRTRSYETSSGVVVIISTTENLKRTNKECEEATFTFRNWELESIYR